MRTLQTGKSTPLNTPNARNILIVFLSCYLGVALATSFIRTSPNPNLSVDFYAYWMPIQYLRQGINPYIELANAVDNTHAPLHFPIPHLEGFTRAGQFEGVFGRPIPANTPMMLYILYPLSLLTWENARVIWMLINFGIAVLIVQVSLRVIEPDGAKRTRSLTAMLILIFFCFLPLRNTLINGQTTGIVFLCMLAAVWFAHRQRKTVSGIFLGLALSKYTLGMALIVYFIYKRQWRALFIAFALQGIAFLSLPILTSSDLLSTVEAYIALASPHLDNDSIHIGGYILASPLSIIMIVSGIFLIIGIVVQRASRDYPQDTRDLWMLSLTILWALLVIYHRYYDLALLIFPLTLLIIAARTPSPTSTLLRSTRWKIVVAGILCVFLSLPATAISLFATPVMEEFYRNVRWALGTLSAIVLSGVIVILSRETGTSPPSPLHNDMGADTLNNSSRFENVADAQ